MHHLPLPGGVLGVLISGMNVFPEPPTGQDLGWALGSQGVVTLCFTPGSSCPSVAGQREAVIITQPVGQGGVWHRLAGDKRPP